MVERAVSPATRNADDDPEHLGALLGAVVSDLGIATKLAECEVLLAWEEVAGAQLQHRCAPLRVVDARLELAVPSAAWRTQVSFAKEDLIRKLNERVGRTIIRDIKIVNKALEQSATRSLRAATTPTDSGIGWRELSQPGREEKK